jgi:general secretion pathway protein L
MGFGLLGLAVYFGLPAALVTPVAQSRLRAIEAAIALSDLQGRAGTLLAQREVMQQAVDRIGQIKNVLAERPNGVLVLEALTKALPDDTYLGTLDVTGLKVRIVGLTANAAALMQTLGAQTGFRDVRAPVPAVRNPWLGFGEFQHRAPVRPSGFFGRCWASA